MKNDGNEIEPVSTELALPPDASLSLVAERLVDQARHDGVSLTGDGGLPRGLVQRVLQGALEAEISDHLGYEAHSSDGWGSGNSRNGLYPKTVVTDVGDVRVEVLRDRNGTFDPRTVPVGTRRLAGVDAQIISLYAKGMTTGDIAAHLFDAYDHEIDLSTIGPSLPAPSRPSFGRSFVVQQREPSHANACVGHHKDSSLLEVVRHLVQVPEDHGGLIGRPRHVPGTEQDHRR